MEQEGTSSSRAAAAAFLAADRSCRLPIWGPQDRPKQVGKPSALSTPKAFRPEASIAVAPFWVGIASSTTCMRAAMSTEGGLVACMAWLEGRCTSCQKGAQKLVLHCVGPPSLEG